MFDRPAPLAQLACIAEITTAKDALSSPGSLDGSVTGPQTVQDTAGLDGVFWPHETRQLVVLGCHPPAGRPVMSVRIDEALLHRLSAVAGGSRCALIELALIHMVQSLESAQSAGRAPLVVSLADVQSLLGGTPA